ncbi:MAG TPA: META domain-containing protein [Phnomibacter sp.]|nr:META domain-containing protein [Phnomibacter sp.]
MKKMQISLFAIVFMLMATSCAAPKALNVLELLAGKSFTVESLLGKALNAADFMKGLPSFKFGTDGKLTGSSGCNNFNGIFKVDGTNLSIDPGAMTRMSCPGTGEADFLDALKQVNGLKTVGNTIKLLNGAKEMMSLVPKL